MFDRFYRAESRPDRQAGGTGLGLYIARRLVQAMEAPAIAAAGRD